MSTDIKTGPMKFSDYIAIWLGFTLSFVIVGFLLGLMLAMHYGLTEMLGLCVLAGGFVGVSLGTAAVVCLKFDDGQDITAYQSGVKIPPEELKNNRHSPWAKKQYLYIVLACLAICLTVGMYFGLVFAELPEATASFRNFSLMGAGVGTLIGLLSSTVHYFKQPRFTFPSAKVQKPKI